MCVVLIYVYVVDICEWCGYMCYIVTCVCMCELCGYMCMMRAYVQLVDMNVMCGYPDMVRLGVCWAVCVCAVRICVNCVDMRSIN